MTTRLILTADLHQHPDKWSQLVQAAADQKANTILIAGDLLPKIGGAEEQRLYFPYLRRSLTIIREQTGATVLLYMGNDDCHFLEPLLDELAADGLCVNLAGRVCRLRGLVFCGMNKVRDYPFGYKHYCVPDGDYVTSPIQFMGEGVTYDLTGKRIQIANLREYLLAKPCIGNELDMLAGQLREDEWARSVWMIHQPPAGLGMDILGGGLGTVGSQTILRFIQERQPLLGCSGHIHESPYQQGGHWAARVNRAMWIQPGQVSGRLHYACCDITDDLSIRDLRHNIFGSFPDVD